MIENSTTTVKPKRKPRPKPPRYMRFVPTEQTGLGLLRIQVGKDGLKTTVTEVYVLSEVYADEGQGYQLVKASIDDAKVYHVLLCGLQTSCECPGFLRHQHCKHVDALHHLQERGELS